MKNKASAALAALFFFAGTALATQMGDLAAQMKPGEWKMLTTSNLVNAVGSADVGGGATGGLLGYAEDGAWDPATGQFFFVGGDHNWGVISTKFISYSAGTNAWQVMTRPPWATFLGAMHGYDHNAINPANGTFYCRESYASRNFVKYDIASKAWTRLPTDNLIAYQYACCGGVEYFPELKGLLHVQGNDDGNNTLGVFLYSDSANQWRKLQGGLSGGNGNGFAEYNPVHHVMVFGGRSSLFKIDVNGMITSQKPAPIGMGVNQTIFTLDPVSGDYLVFGRDGSFYVYDVLSDAWKKQAGSRFFDPVAGGGGGDGAWIWQVVATPVSSHGIVMFVKYNGASSAVYLYKHSAGTSVATPATTAPSLRLSAHPNPFTASVALQVEGAGSGEGLEVGIFNPKGERVSRRTADAAGRVEWGAGRNPAGIYLVRARSGKHTLTARIFLRK